MTRLNLKRILVPTDFSDQSKFALRYAAGMAKQFGAEVIVVHVVEQSIAARDLAWSRPWIPQVSDGTASHRTLARWIQEMIPREINTATLVDYGSPSDQIIKISKKHNIDLIVMATRGLSGWKHLILGSTAEKVVRKAPCPVLTARPTSSQDDFEDLPI